MPLENYGVLKAKPVNCINGHGPSPHFHILAIDNTSKHRIAINISSSTEPSDLLYVVKTDFNHPILEGLEKLPAGFTELKNKTEGLDFIRSNLFDRSEMKTLPHNAPGPDNDLNDLLNKYISRAIGRENAYIYAFGEPWGPENNRRDSYFGFLPGRGIHDIHMNQGSSKRWEYSDGVWQDGGLLIHLPDKEQWIAIFLAFQSQSFHTDDITGHRIEYEPQQSVRIISALIDPVGQDRGSENITLLNPTPEDISLDGWSIVDNKKRRSYLRGTIRAGACVKIKLSGRAVILTNSGGAITLLDESGLKVHGVSYTKKDMKGPGWTHIFHL